MSLSICVPARAHDLSRARDLDSFLKCQQAATQRKILFFDESVSVFVILNHDAPHKAVFMDVSVVPGAPVTAPRTSESSEMHAQEPAVLASFSLADSSVFLRGKSTETGSFYTVWTYQVPIVYPKKKVEQPQISIVCYCRDSVPLSAKNSSTVSEETQVELLPDFVPRHSTNLLAELNNPVLGTQESPHFEFLSLFIEPSLETRSLPVPETTSHEETLYETKVTIPVSVSLVIRLKSTKPAGRNNVLLATLNVESSEEFASLVADSLRYYFSILSLNVSFKNGSLVKPSGCGDKLPMRIRLADALNLTYKLVNADIEREPQDTQAGGGSKTLNIRLVLQVQYLEPSTNTLVDVSNEITTLWAPLLDFAIMAPPINSSLRTSTGYSQVQAVGSVSGRVLSRRPALQNAPVVKSSSNLSLVGSANPAATPLKLVPLSSSNVTVSLSNNPGSALAGLKLTFIGSFSLKLGEVSSWNIQAVNHSGNTLSLSIIMQDPLSLVPTAQRPQVPNGSFSNVLGNKPNDLLVINKIHLLSEIGTMKPRAGGVVFLENDLRLGPLETSNVMETSVRLMGVSRGIHSLEGIKVFDTITGDGLDFGKLVQVFVV